MEAFDSCHVCQAGFPCWGDRSACRRGFALPPHDAARHAEIEQRTRPAPAVTLDEALAVLREMVDAVTIPAALQAGLAARNLLSRAGK